MALLPLLPRVTPFLIRRHVASLPSEMNRGARTLAVSFGIISQFLNDEWTHRHFASSVFDNKARPGFFSLDVDTKETREFGAHRAYELAELMLNLQTVEGFNDRVQELLSAASTKLESTFAELQVGGLLHQHWLPFRFLPKKQNSTRGEDYDFDVFRYQSLKICVEAKCKLERADASAASIFSSLRTGLKQVPKGQPAVLFVKVPQSWWDGGKLMAHELERVTYRFMGATTRVISVVYYTPFVTIENGRLNHRHMWREYENSKSRFRNDAPTLFQNFDSPPTRQGASASWIHLMPLIEGD